MYNLKKQRFQVQSWNKRPYGAPPPAPSDLECKLEGCPKDYLKERMRELLQRIHHNMSSRGFMLPRSSTAHLQSGFTRDGTAG